MQNQTPKHFVVQLGAIISLYVSITALIVLVFSVINIIYPDASYSWETEAARESIRGAMAFLIVFFPAYIVLTRMSAKDRALVSNGEYVGITRWLVYVSLLVAGGVLLGDLVTLINYFLNGEVTTRFLLKVFALFVIVGSAFHYYLLDVRGYFKTHRASAVNFALGASIAVVAALGYGFTHIETPAEVREMRLDEVMVTDLQAAQANIENFYLQQNRLPNTLEEAFGAIPVPVAPEDRAAYRYEPAAERDYHLCATFAAPTRQLGDGSMYVPEPNYDWNHQAGEWCFTRTIPEVAVKPELMLQ